MTRSAGRHGRSKLEWRDVTDARGDDGLLVAVRRGKTNPDGETADVRFASRATSTQPTASSASPRRPSANGSPRGRPGIEPRLTTHSGHVGLATELTALGASAHNVMLAGNWKTVRMVAHYSAGASAERGAVARYL